MFVNTLRKQKYFMDSNSLEMFLQIAEDFHLVETWGFITVFVILCPTIVPG